MSTFSEKIKQLRIENKKLSLGQAAKQLGIPKSTLNNWERGSSFPPLPKLCRLASFYYVSPNYLLGFEYDPEAIKISSSIMSLPPEAKANVVGILNILQKNIV